MTTFKERTSMACAALAACTLIPALAAQDPTRDTARTAPTTEDARYVAFDKVRGARVMLSQDDATGGTGRGEDREGRGREDRPGGVAGAAMGETLGRVTDVLISTSGASRPVEATGGREGREDTGRRDPTDPTARPSEAMGTGKGGQAFVLIELQDSPNGDRERPTERPTGATSGRQVKVPLANLKWNGEGNYFICTKTREQIEAMSRDTDIARAGDPTRDPTRPHESNGDSDKHHAKGSDIARAKAKTQDGSEFPIAALVLDTQMGTASCLLVTPTGATGETGDTETGERQPTARPGASGREGHVVPWNFVRVSAEGSARPGDTIGGRETGGRETGGTGRETGGRETGGRETGGRETAARPEPRPGMSGQVEVEITVTKDRVLQAPKIPVDDLAKLDDPECTVKLRTVYPQDSGTGR